MVVKQKQKEYKLECADCGVTYTVSPTHNKDYIYCDECNAKPIPQEEVDEMMKLVDELKESLSALSDKMEAVSRVTRPSKASFHLTPE